MIHNLWFINMSHTANELNSPSIYARIARKIDSSMIQQNYVDKLSFKGYPVQSVLGLRRMMTVRGHLRSSGISLTWTKIHPQFPFDLHPNPEHWFDLKIGFFFPLVRNNWSILKWRKKFPKNIWPLPNNGSNLTSNLMHSS